MGLHDSSEIPGVLALTAGSQCFCPPTNATATTNATSLTRAAVAPASAADALASAAVAPASAANESANATAAASLVAWHSKANASRSASHQIVIAHAHQIADVLFRQDVKWNEAGSRLTNFFFNA